MYATIIKKGTKTYNVSVFNGIEPIANFEKDYDYVEYLINELSNVYKVEEKNIEFMEVCNETR